MKKTSFIIVIIIVVVSAISIHLITSPKVLGNMSKSYSEQITTTSDISFSGEAGDRIKFSFKSDIISGNLDMVLYDSVGNEVYTLDSAKALETFFTLERHGNQFSKTSQILEDSSKQSSIILDIALFDEILTLYCFSRLMENLRSRFKFCWIVLFSMRQ